jgi:DNA-binding response OmpR family regulator
MLVEDEALIAFTLQAELAEGGYTVAGPFPTCAAALEWLGGNSPDLALLDAVLKDGSCREVAAKLSERGVPFAVYSGYPEDRTDAAEFTGATWIDKPAQADVILAVLKTLRPDAP